MVYPLPPLCTPSQWKRACLTAWRIVTMEILMGAARTEITRLTKKLGKKSGSIWNMDKSEIVEVARMELGLTLAQAEKMTVTVLREKIREQRQILKMAQDPMM